MNSKQMKKEEIYNTHDNSKKYLLIYFIFSLLFIFSFYILGNLYILSIT